MNAIVVRMQKIIIKYFPKKKLQQGKVISAKYKLRDLHNPYAFIDQDE